MRLLVVGALSIGYVRDHWVAPLRRYLDAVFVDVSPLLEAEQDGFHEHYILRILKESRTDRMFFYSDAIQAFFSEEFFTRVGSLGVEVVAFHADDDPETWFQQNTIHDYRYDYIFSPSSRGVLRRLDKGVTHASFLPWGYNAELYSVLIPGETLYDLVFVGTNLGHETANGHYYRDGDSRQRILVELYEFCRQKGYRFQVFGYGWERHPILKEVAGGFPDHDKLQDIYRQTAILFNPGFTADDRYDWQTKLRHFEAAGSGVFQVVNDNPELADLFVPDEEMVFYRDNDDLKDKINHYLSKPEERRRIADNAARKARSCHRTEHRLEKMFPDARKHVIQDEVEVELFRVADRDELRSLYLALQRGDVRPEAPVCQIIGGEVEIVGREFTVLPPDWQTTEVDAWGVRSYLQLGTRHGNRIQRKKQDMYGVILPERFDGARMGMGLFNRVTALLPGIQDEDHYYPICNYLVRAERLHAFIDTILRQDSQDWAELGIFWTGRLVNDLRVPHPMASDRLNTGYLRVVRDLFRQCEISGQRVVIYGARGDMVDQVLSVLGDYPKLRIAGLVDRGIAGQQVAGFEVEPPERLEALQPDLVLIAAESSGPKIHDWLLGQGCKLPLLPLYDHKAPIWRVMLP